MSLFENVVPALAQALSERGFETLTPVQEAALNPDLQGQDLVVSAQTGSGKTVAFGLAMAEALLGGHDRFASDGAPLALVIAPTRELALQVKRELDWLYGKAGGKVVSCVGGMDSRDERRALDRGSHIVVGTPGRLVDHIRRGALNMESLQCVVLDEADEMLNMGFREELEHILDASPDDRRTLMFSATMPRAIEALAKKYQRNAVRVNTVSEAKQHLDIDYRALVAASHDAENAIFNVLRFYDAPNAIVFCSTRAAVSRLMSRFSNRGFSVVALSGELSQTERSHALQAMRDHRAQVCVATDVAARGIDLPDLELVIHADLPKNREGLLHRSGRTGRAGRKGTSVLIVPHKAQKRTERLLRDAGIDATWGTPPSVDEIKQRDDERLLNDELLSVEIEENEHAVIASLLEQHGAEQVAAAFLRLHRKGKAAPEEISSAPVAPFERHDRNERFDRSDRGERRERKPREAPKQASRDDFENGVWVSLSAGRDKSAEPRWLIPLLCKAGGMTKSNIGSIRIQDTETHVELDPEIVDQFFQMVGAEGKLEKSIIATRMDGKAPATASVRPARTERPERSERFERPARPARAERPAREERPARAERPPRKEKWSPDDKPPSAPQVHEEVVNTDTPNPTREPTTAPQAAPKPVQARDDAEPVRKVRYDKPNFVKKKWEPREGGSDRPARPARAERPERSDRPARPTKHGKPFRENRADRADSFKSRAAAPRPDRERPSPERSPERRPEAASAPASDAKPSRNTDPSGRMKLVKTARKPAKEGYVKRTKSWNPEGRPGDGGDKPRGKPAFKGKPKPGGKSGGKPPGKHGPSKTAPTNRNKRKFTPGK